MSEYLGFRLCNLIIPGDPEGFQLRTPSGIWQLERESRYSEIKHAIGQAQVGETYCLMTSVVVRESGRSAALDAALDELVHICLAASYLTGASVAVTRSLPHSGCELIQVGSHFPRPRAIQGVSAVVTTQQEFIERVEAFVRNHPSTGIAEKDRLLVHHWIDAVACWSMEDLCLSTATLLEIIAATANRTGKAAGQTLNSFSQRINFAASRFGLSALSVDFRNMRNDLVHEGALSIKNFPNKSNEDCAKAVGEALHWIDQYVHAALGLGPQVKNRFSPDTFRGLNAFSLD